MRRGVRVLDELLEVDLLGVEELLEVGDGEEIHTDVEDAARAETCWDVQHGTPTNSLTRVPRLHTARVFPPTNGGHVPDVSREPRTGH